MDYKNIVLCYAKTRLDLIKAKQNLHDFNNDFQDDEYCDITSYRSENDYRTWTEIIKSTGRHEPVLIRLANLLD